MLSSTAVDVSSATYNHSHLQNRRATSMCSNFNSCDVTAASVNSAVRHIDIGFAPNSASYVEFLGYPNYSGFDNVKVENLSHENIDVTQRKPNQGKWQEAPPCPPVTSDSTSSERRTNGAYGQSTHRTVPAFGADPTDEADNVMNNIKKEECDTESTPHVYAAPTPMESPHCGWRYSSVNQQSPIYDPRPSSSYLPHPYHSYTRAAFHNSPLPGYAYTSPPHSSANSASPTEAARKTGEDQGPLYHWQHPQYHGEFAAMKNSRLGSNPNWTVQGKNNCKVALFNGDMWAKFHAHTNEMIITKHGRRMFPVLHFLISGLDPDRKYRVYVGMDLADEHHWKFQAGKWVSCGAAEPLSTEGRIYVHPDSPNTGAHWMKQEVIFSKLKLTNNKSCTLNNQIILNSMHRYQPKIFICEDTEEGKELISHGFVDTQFIAVTAYQNTDITDLKVKYNPYARGMIDKCSSRMGMEQVSPQHQFSPYGQGMSPEHQNVHTSPLPGMSVPNQHPPMGSTPLTQTNGHVYPSSSDTFQQRFDIGHNSPESGVSYYETPYATRTPNYMHVHGYKHPGVTPYVGSPGAPHPRSADSDCLYSPGGSSGGALALTTRNPQFHRSPPIQSGQRSIPTSLVNISASSFGPNGQASLDSTSSLSTQRKVPASSQHLHGEHFLNRQENDMGKDSHYNHTSPFMASFLLTTKDDPEAEDEKDFGQLQEEAAKVTLNLLCRSPVRKRRK